MKNKQERLKEIPTAAPTPEANFYSETDDRFRALPGSEFDQSHLHPNAQVSSLLILGVMDFHFHFTLTITLVCLLVCLRAQNFLEASALPIGMDLQMHGMKFNSKVKLLHSTTFMSSGLFLSFNQLWMVFLSLIFK